MSNAKQTNNHSMQPGYLQKTITDTFKTLLYTDSSCKTLVDEYIVIKYFLFLIFVVISSMYRCKTHNRYIRMLLDLSYTTLLLNILSQYQSEDTNIFTSNSITSIIVKISFIVVLLLISNLHSKILRIFNSYISNVILSIVIIYSVVSQYDTIIKGSDKNGVEFNKVIDHKSILNNIYKLDQNIHLQFNLCIKQSGKLLVKIDNFNRNKLNTFKKYLKENMIHNKHLEKIVNPMFDKEKVVDLYIKLRITLLCVILVILIFTYIKRRLIKTLTFSLITGIILCLLFRSNINTIFNSN